MNVNIFEKIMFRKLDKQIICRRIIKRNRKIRCEAQDNGNINWDDDYSYFGDFISGKLTEQPVFFRNRETRN